MFSTASARSPLAAIALTLCLTVPLVAGDAPGSYRSEVQGECNDLPCLKWTGTHDSPDNEAAAHHVVLSPDGQIAYVVGATFTWETSTDLATWAVDARSGELLWSAAYDGGSDEQEWWYLDVDAITVSPDGSRVAVVGTSTGSYGHRHDIVTVVYDAATGDELWTDRFNGPDSRDDGAVAVAVDASGKYVVTAGSVDDDDDGRSGILLGHDLVTGQALWQRPFDSPCGDSDIIGLQATPASSDLFVGGLRTRCVRDAAEAPTDAGLAFTPTVWAIDPATGGLQWEAEDLDPSLTMQSAMFLGALDVNDDRVVLGSRITNPRNPNADLDLLTMAVDLSGDILWRARYDSGGRDDLLGIRLAPDGTAYVVATSPALAAAGEQDQNPDIVVIAYDQGGEVGWDSRLDSSTTGVQFQGKVLGGEGQEVAPISSPALFDGGQRLVLGYGAWVLSPIPFVGAVDRGVETMVVLDTADGEVVAVRTEDQKWDQYSYVAEYDRADFIGVGAYGQGYESSATIRRFSMDVVAPELDVPASLNLEAQGPAGAVAHFTARAVDDRDGEVAVECDPGPGSTLPLGETEVTCAASDSYGNTASASFTATVQDTTPPVLDVPSRIDATATGLTTPVGFGVTASDIVDGDVVPSCSHASGQAFPLGSTTVTCSATDAAGNTASASFDVVVTLAWSGFQDPVHDGGAYAHGRTLPIRVELTGGSAGIEDAELRLWIRSGSADVPAIGRGEAGNRLTYDAETGVYGINWDTSTVMPGDHVLRLDLGDGTWNTVRIHVS